MGGGEPEKETEKRERDQQCNVLGFRTRQKIAASVSGHRQYPRSATLWKKMICPPCGVVEGPAVSSWKRG